MAGFRALWTFPAPPGRVRFPGLSIYKDSAPGLVKVATTHDSWRMQFGWLSFLVKADTNFLTNFVGLVFLPGGCFFLFGTVPFMNSKPPEERQLKHTARYKVCKVFTKKGLQSRRATASLFGEKKHSLLLFWLKESRHILGSCWGKQRCIFPSERNYVL